MSDTPTSDTSPIEPALAPAVGEAPTWDAGSTPAAVPVEAPAVALAGATPGRGEGDAMVGTSPIKVQLPAFDGPLDLLLHLIKRDEINIYDIPISHITGEYLAYIGMLQLLDLDVAGDFLVMAATLMRIKARMLLPPVPGVDEEDEEFLDPRDELVQQLLEYRRFKEAAERLHGAEEARRLLWTRGALPRFESEELPELMPVGLFALIDVMKDVLARVGDEFFHEVILEEVSLEEKVALIEGELQSRGRVLFLELLERTPRRMHVVVTLMAVLEMARLGKLAVRQEKLFGQIWLYQAELAPPLELEVMDDAPPPPTGPAWKRKPRARKAGANGSDPTAPDGEGVFPSDADGGAAEDRDDDEEYEEEIGEFADDAETPVEAGFAEAPALVPDGASTAEETPRLPDDLLSAALDTADELIPPPDVAEEKDGPV